MQHRYTPSGANSRPNTQRRNNTGGELRTDLGTNGEADGIDDAGGGDMLGVTVGARILSERPPDVCFQVGGTSLHHVAKSGALHRRHERVEGHCADRGVGQCRTEDRHLVRGMSTTELSEHT